jgi:hypothetical protein
VVLPLNEIVFDAVFEVAVQTLLPCLEEGGNREGEEKEGRGREEGERKEKGGRETEGGGGGKRERGSEERRKGSEEREGERGRITREDVRNIGGSYIQGTYLLPLLCNHPPGSAFFLLQVYNHLAGYEWRPALALRLSMEQLSNKGGAEEGEQKGEEGRERGEGREEEG